MPLTPDEEEALYKWGAERKRLREHEQAVRLKKAKRGATKEQREAIKQKERDDKWQAAYEARKAARKTYWDQTLAERRAKYGQNVTPVTSQADAVGHNPDRDHTK